MQSEDRPDSPGRFLVAGVRDGTDGSDGAAAANRRACGNEKSRNAWHAQQSTQAHAGEQREAYAEKGVDKSAAARMHNLMQVHSETEPPHGSLQQQFGELPGFAV